MACIRLALWIFCALLYGGSCRPPLPQRGAFSSALRLTRTVRARVQQLLLQYKEQQFGDILFEDRRLVLNSLPSVTINIHKWRHMQDSERLSIASRDLYTFWTHLESQRQKLWLERQEESDGERVMQRRSRRGRPQLSLTQSMLGIQLDLRDLIRQVNFQLAHIIKEDPTTTFTSTPSPTSAFSSPTQATPALQSSEEPVKPATTTSQTTKPTSSSPIASMPGPHSTLGRILTSTPLDRESANGRQTVPASTVEAPSTEGVAQASMVTAASTKGQPKLTTQVSGPSRWVSRLEGYVILRDLERYLSRLARDYALLQAKY
ncbi:hypothetical protein NFI96_025125 [Prochilodus magdalenae]|nr:hypothetical protein NFI96_025125 [Prochilodus magdalenae]